jgi:hypothetical protein
MSNGKDLVTKVFDDPGVVMRSSKYQKMVEEIKVLPEGKWYGVQVPSDKLQGVDKEKRTKVVGAFQSSLSQTLKRHNLTVQTRKKEDGDDVFILVRQGQPRNTKKKNAESSV